MSLLLSCIQVRGGRREEDSGLGTRVYLWQIHVDIWQNQYNIVKLKIKKKKLERKIKKLAASLFLIGKNEETKNKLKHIYIT